MRRGSVILEISLKYLLILKLFLQKVWPYTCVIVDTGEKTRIATFSFHTSFKRNKMSKK